MKIPDIIVVNGHGLGEYCDVKTIPLPGETCVAYNRRFEMDAGKGTNVACAIGRLGGSVALVAKSGRDLCGELGYKWITESNVSPDYYWTDPSIESCLGLCIIAENGENLLLDFDDDLYAVQPDEAERCIRKMKGAKFLAAGFSQSVETGLRACEVGKELGMYTLLNPSPLRDDVRLPEMPYVDVLCVNENEALRMLGYAGDHNASYRRLGAELQDTYKCPNIVITLGAAGCAAFTVNGSWYIPVVKVHMVDETGAGDGFLAALVYRLNCGKSLKEAMEWANAYSAYIVTKSGSLEHYPWADQIPEIFTRLDKVGLLD